MARVANKLRAQLLTTDAKGQQVKRSFNKIRTDINDEDLTSFAKAVGLVLHGENVVSVNLTTNASLDL